MNNERRNGDHTKGIIVDLITYVIAFAVGAVPFAFIENVFLATAAFTGAATLIIYIVTVIFSDVSVYDPYWSVAPPVMLFIIAIKYGLWNVNSVIILAVVTLWAFRLTANWLYTYKGLGREDWRYAKYRKTCSPIVFQAISFIGLQFIPTAVVYAGLTSGIFAMSENGFSPFSLIGVAVMLSAVLLEYVSDKAIHGFLSENAGKGKTCNVSVWKYSRHPNYLGELSFWTGLYLYFVALRPDIWYMGLGFIAVITLFLSVSIPLMEKHNSERRSDYAEYKEKTSVLLLLPPKKRRG